jgi:N-succinyldiaminopimelate aminotransferase
MAEWVGRRYGVQIDPDTQIMGLNGTREGLFNAAIALCPETKAGRGRSCSPRTPSIRSMRWRRFRWGPSRSMSRRVPRRASCPTMGLFRPRILDRTAIAYLCSPANPQGGRLARLLGGPSRLPRSTISASSQTNAIPRSGATRPPPGALEAAQAVGADPERVLIFHSLSKRSNLAGPARGLRRGRARTASPP